MTDSGKEKISNRYQLAVKPGDIGSYSSSESRHLSAPEVNKEGITYTYLTVYLKKRKSVSFHISMCSSLIVVVVNRDLALDLSIKRDELSLSGFPLNTSNTICMLTPAVNPTTKRFALGI